MENNMITISMAKTPWGFLFFIFFSLSFFFFVYQETRHPLHFIWNFHKCIVKKSIRTWNNIISTKLKKVERNYNLNPYIKLSQGVSF